MHGKKVFHNKKRTQKYVQKMCDTRKYRHWIAMYQGREIRVVRGGIKSVADEKRNSLFPYYNYTARSVL